MTIRQRACCERASAGAAVSVWSAAGMDFRRHRRGQQGTGILQPTPKGAVAFVADGTYRSRRSHIQRLFPKFGEQYGPVWNSGLHMSTLRGGIFSLPKSQQLSADLLELRIVDIFHGWVNLPAAVHLSLDWPHHSTRLGQESLFLGIDLYFTGVSRACDRVRQTGLFYITKSRAW